MKFKKKKFTSEELKMVYQDLTNIIDELHKLANDFPTEMDAKELKEYAIELEATEKDLENAIEIIKFLRDEQDLRNFKNGVDKLFQKAFTYLTSFATK